MAVRDGRGDEKQTTAGFRGPLMVQSLTSAKSKFLSLSAKSKFLSLSAKSKFLSLASAFCWVRAPMMVTGAMAPASVKGVG